MKGRSAEYQKCRLAAYLKTEETQKLNDDELIMDMFQILTSGSYGFVTHVSHLPVLAAHQHQKWCYYGLLVEALERPVDARQLHVERDCKAVSVCMR